MPFTLQLSRPYKTDDGVWLVSPTFEFSSGLTSLFLPDDGSVPFTLQLPQPYKTDDVVLLVSPTFYFSFGLASLPFCPRPFCPPLAKLSPRHEQRHSGDRVPCVRVLLWSGAIWWFTFARWSHALSFLAPSFLITESESETRRTTTLCWSCHLRTSSPLVWCYLVIYFC